jgi:glyoxylase-like metal-dependent hydrolase (beta-lactamase superfamily II)
MKIKLFTNGSFEMNTYLLTNDSEAILIDPGTGIIPLLGEIKNRSLNLAAVFVTHPHIDHLDGIPHVKNIFPDVPRYISKDAVPLLSHVQNQARMFGVKDPGIIEFSHTISGDQVITTGSFSVTCLSTPGHCVGSISFLIEGNLFPGDVLFKESIGRTDLPGGDITALRKSIEKKLFTLPDATPVYPGHGEATTIGYEKKHNPFFTMY